MTQGEHSPTRTKNGGDLGLRGLLRLGRPELRALALGMVLTLAASAAYLAQPLAVKTVLERLADDGALTGPVVLLAALALVGALLTAGQVLVLQRAGERIVLGVRRGLIRRLTRLTLPALGRERPADLTARVTSDATVLRSATTNAVVDVVGSGVEIVAAIVLMSILDWRLTAVTVLVVAVVVVLLGIVLPRLRRQTEQAQTAIGDLGAELDRTLGALRTIKGAGAEERAEALAASTAQTAADAGMRAARYQAAIVAGTDLALQTAFLLVLGVGGALTANGDLGVPTLIAFLLYLGSLTEPLTNGSQALAELQEGLGTLPRLNAAHELETEDLADGRSAPAPASAPAAGGALALRGVRFAYGEDRPILTHVDLDVPPRALTAIVGPSGAGKSTLLSLLPRFTEPDAGTITLDGIDLRAIELRAVRSRIMVVDQDSPVLEGTLRQNLTLAAPGASDAEIDTAVAEAQLEGLVSRLPEGLETSVGTRGSSLSGGERQRVAIARALLGAPEVLVLDEATSQLDTVTEAALRTVVDRLAKDITVIAVAHRLSTVRRACQIAILDGGRIRAIGTHDHLLATDELYAELVASQLDQGAAEAP